MGTPPVARLTDRSGIRYPKLDIVDVGLAHLDSCTGSRRMDQHMGYAGLAHLKVIFCLRSTVQSIAI